MCGLSGFIDTKKICDFNLLKNMTNALNHRGPDSEGFFFEEKSNFNLGLGHKRLSILDLSKNGNQPLIFNENVIIYNGEIYNFLDIKKELQNFHYKFNSNSDTEVILKAYDKWGINCVNKFIGMFAVIIYDKKKRRVVLIRDRVGVKPLYYYHHNGLFMFASELKSFHKNSFFNKEIDLKGLELFFQYGYILEPFSIFKFTKKLRAGHYIEYDLNNNSVKENKYWDVSNYYKKEKLDISFEEASIETERLLISSFKYRMISDVPVGVFLSSGYDSGGLTAILKKNINADLKTFTIGFNNSEIDEAKNAKEIAKFLGTDHNQLYCSEIDALRIVKILPEVFDEPFGDPSSIPTILLSEFASNSVKVALSADGGDEIFAGYNKYILIEKYFNFFENFSVVKKIFSYFNFTNNKTNFFFSRYSNLYLKYNFFTALIKNKNKSKLMEILSNIFSGNERNGLINDDYLNEFGNINNNFTIDQENMQDDQYLCLDFKTYLLDDILVKIDRSGMHSSLETREPLLDHRLIEFVSQLPLNYKIKNKSTKLIFKDIVHKYVPDQIFSKKKIGFTPPLKQWMQKDFKDLLNLYLGIENLKKQKVLNINYVINLYKKFVNGDKVNINKLWLVLTFLMWHKHWIEK
jgi:asparagine synthase (glutamine-hydrolysing)